MRRIIGKQLTEVDIGWVAASGRTIVDLGTGDGTAVLRLARQRPDTLVIGIDTNAAATADASRRAARKPVLPNAVFLVADATDALQCLRGRADEVRITLPWGSLLRHVLEGERKFALAVAGTLWRGGQVRVLVSLTERDAPANGHAATGPEVFDAFAAALQQAGLQTKCREATAEDVSESGSAWAKRLGIPTRRSAWLLVAKQR